MGDPQRVPRQPDYISLGNGICGNHSGMKINELVDNSVGEVGERDGKDSSVVRQKMSLVSIQEQNRVIGENLHQNENIEFPFVSTAQKLSYRAKVQNQLDAASRQLDRFITTSKSIADAAESFCRSALMSTQVVQKNFDALAADLAGNRELLLHSIEKKRRSVISKLERRAGDIAKVTHQLERATEYAERALSEDDLLGSQYGEIMKTLAEAMIRPCECLVAAPDPDHLHVLFDGDSLLILKSQIQRFSSIEGGAVDISCKCKLTDSAGSTQTPLPQSPARRPSILLTPSRKRVNSEATRSKSTNKVVRINTDRPDSQLDEECKQKSLEEPLTHVTARKSTSGKLDVVLPKFRRFRPSPSPTAKTPTVATNSSASHIVEKDNQDSSSQTESSRESSAEISPNEASDTRSPASPGEKKAESATSPVKMSTQKTFEVPKLRIGRLLPPKFEPIPLRTRSSSIKGPSVRGRRRRRASDQGKPVEAVLRRLDLDAVIPSRRRPASVSAATELQQTRLKREAYADSDDDEDDDEEERQLAAVIALSAVEAQQQPKAPSEMPTVILDEAQKRAKAPSEMKAVILDEAQKQPKAPSEMQAVILDEAQKQPKAPSEMPTVILDEAPKQPKAPSEMQTVIMDEAKTDGHTELSARKEIEQPSDIQTSGVQSEASEPALSQSDSLDASLAVLPQPLETKASPSESPEPPRRLLARKSAGPTVKPEEINAEIKDIRELPVYHTCTDTYGIFYVDRYYKPVHPCVLCLKCGNTLATFQFATHSHSNDPKRCLTKKWRHCIRVKHPDNNSHQVMFQLLKERFGHKNPRGSGSKKTSTDSVPKEVKRKKRKSSDAISYLPYPSIVETSEELTRFPRRIGQAYTGESDGPRPVSGELACVVPPVNEYDGQPWIGQVLRFTNEDETEAELKWLRGTYSQPWSFEKRQRFMIGKVPLDSVAFYGFTLRSNGRLYAETVECIRHELEETEESDQATEKL